MIFTHLGEERPKEIPTEKIPHKKEPIADPVEIEPSKENPINPLEDFA